MFTAGFLFDVPGQFFRSGSALTCRLGWRTGCLWTVLLAVWLAGVTGCGSLGIFVRPKDKRENIPLPPGVVAPREKLARWRELVKKARGTAEVEAAARQLEQAFLTEEDPLLRAELLRLLAQLDHRPDPHVLSRAAADGEPLVRSTLCTLLAHQDAATGVPILQDLALNDPDPEVRQAAIKALGRTKDPAAAQTLVKLLRNRDPAVQYLAAQALKGVTGQDFGLDAGRWESYVYGTGTPSANRPSVAGRDRPRF